LNRFSVTFDLWDTLINDQAGYDQKRRALRCNGMVSVFESYGLRVSPDRVFSAYDASVGWLQVAWLTHREIAPVDQAKRIATEAVGKLPNDKELVQGLEEVYVNAVLDLPPRLSDDAVETLQGMQGRAAKIGLVCNIGRSSGRVLRELLKKLHVLDFFDATIFSDEIGIRKPDRRIFEIAAERLGVEISSVIHIGDHPEADVWGAKQVGMRALLLELPTELLTRDNLASLWRSTKQVSDSDVRPDGRIRFLKQALAYVDRLEAGST
jgi:putative hydrolase of the HAD superfamily